MVRAAPPKGQRQTARLLLGADQILRTGEASLMRGRAARMPPTAVLAALLFALVPDAYVVDIAS